MSSIRLVSYGQFGADIRGSSSNLYYTSGGCNYVVGIFSNSGTATFVAPQNFDLFDVLVVGGGGAGGGDSSTQGLGGGGGGGGVVYASNLSLTSNSYSITVGTGGATFAASGTNSVFLSYTGVGGGGGGQYNFAGPSKSDGKSGGCGGGAGLRTLAGAGSQGGNGAGPSEPSGNAVCGGGGGAGGTPGVANSGSTGQIGFLSAITGSNVYYGGGGGGGSDLGGNPGGQGGGGAGATGAIAASPGSNGFGGGGGGTCRGNTTGAVGGSGIVLLRGRVKQQIALSQLRMTNLVPVSQTAVYLATGAVQTFTVPVGVFSIRFFLWGAGGVGQNGSRSLNSGSGSGAYMEGNIQTTPGTVYSIVAGRLGVFNVAPAIANGGASGGGTGAGGGGFSGIFLGATPSAATVIAIAGGGGGSGLNGAGPGGGGGYPAGASVTGGANGGTQTAGGTGTYPGSQFAGGVAGFGGDCCGGGGGGGWYGGAGGNFPGFGGGYGGAGGSSTFISSVFNVVSVNGNTGPIGLAANQASPFWISPYGQSGQTGLVVIGYTPVPLSPTIFNYTGAYQTYTVPSGVSSVSVYMWGAGGGRVQFAQLAGGGAYVTGILPVTPGETLRLIVGAGGHRGVTGDQNGGNGVAGGSSPGGYGGGRTAIQRLVSGSYTDIVVAGAGGGGGGEPINSGGGNASWSGTSFTGGAGSVSYTHLTLPTKRIV